VFGKVRGGCEKESKGKREGAGGRWRRAKGAESGRIRLASAERRQPTPRSLSLPSLRVARSRTLLPIPHPHPSRQATNTTGFIPYSGDGFALLLPSKWNPRRQQVTPGVVLTYEDNGDAVNHVDVIARKSASGSIDGYGAPDKFLNEVVRPLLGEQSYTGETRSEGGFGANKVSAASLLDVQEAKDAAGKTYYKYNILTRTADGNEGGRHHLVTAAVGGGNLYIAHVTVGDKRWFKGVDKDALGIYNSFTVA